MKFAVVFSFLLLAGAASGAAPVKLKAAAVQFRSSFDVEENRKRIVETLAKLSGEGVNVAVFPECALTGYHKDAVLAAEAIRVAAAEDSIRQACATGRIAAIVGSVYKINGKTYNTAVVFNSRGELVERYAKIYLAGEKWATPGNHIALFDLEGVTSTVIICHDERYPELARLPALAGARVLYYISHESGMANERKLVPYRAQMLARAVENHMFAVAANAPANVKDNSGSHGQSRIIFDDGNIAKEASFYGEEILVETLSIEPAKLERPFKELLKDWWRQGFDWMMANRGKPLD
jgi:predicted amidohydrolase